MNPRTKKVATVLGIASLILAWRVWVIIADYTPDSAQADQAQPEVVDAVEHPNLPDPFAGMGAKQKSLEEGPWGRNPFSIPEELKTGVVKSIAEPALKDNKPLAPPSIGFSGASRVGDTYRAILKTGIVAVGDAVDGSFTVKAIDRTSIVLVSGSWNYIYELGSEMPIVRRAGEDQ